MLLSSVSLSAAKSTSVFLQISKSLELAEPSTCSLILYSSVTRFLTPLIALSTSSICLDDSGVNFLKNPLVSSSYFRLLLLLIYF